MRRGVLLLQDACSSLWRHERVGEIGVMSVCPRCLLLKSSSSVPREALVCRPPSFQCHFHPISRVFSYEASLVKAKLFWGRVGYSRLSSYTFASHGKRLAPIIRRREINVCCFFEGRGCGPLLPMPPMMDVGRFPLHSCYHELWTTYPHIS